MQDDRDDTEMRERLGSLGCENVFVVVEVVAALLLLLVEEEEDEASLRSDTRLPLESSPYMAGNF